MSDSDWVWFYYGNDNTKRMDVSDNSEKEFKVIYKNESNRSFSVLFKPKKYPIGFRAKF